jgi:hypothetical protein
LPARRNLISTSPTPHAAPAATQSNGTPAFIARSIIPAADRGLVEKAGLGDYEHAICIGQLLECIVAHDVA